jgi:predicted RND superfamily exporter protein
MVRELAITASLGVAFKIITNLVMLPLVASMIHVTKEYAESEEQSRLRRSKWLHSVASLAEPRKAKIMLIAAVVLMGVSAWQSSDRVIGTLQAGAPELKADARYNTDSVMIASNYDVGLDWLTVCLKRSGGYKWVNMMDRLHTHDSQANDSRGDKEGLVNDDTKATT